MEQLKHPDYIKKIREQLEAKKSQNLQDKKSEE